MDSTSIDIPNSRALVKQILTLAQDVDNQPFIVQEEGCLAGLCSYMNHEDVDVVLMATRAIDFLSSHPLAKEPIKEFPNLVSTLKSVHEGAHSHPKAKEFTYRALVNLQVQVSRDSSFEDTENVSSYANLQVNIVETTPNNKKATSYLTADEYSPLNEGDIPEYLEEDDYEDDSSEDDEGPNTKKITKYGCSTLEARLEQQRLDEEKKKRDERLIGKVGNIFSSASSWLLGY
mmetsp:Transcript_35913/g.44572  ORF Transcript_35913/g.44572 Transcript_35913/m.44572 type:complete len:232 (-) Transcript_35913:2324-3019(-)